MQGGISSTTLWFVFSRKGFQYLFFEVWPAFFLGLLVFLFVLLMFQVLRYTEFVLIHGVGLRIMFRLITYMTVSFLPALFPMALLFSVLTTYTRLSQDSELLALKASGISSFWILTPAVLVASIVAIISAQTSFQIAPWGNRQFEILINHLSQSKASASIREGTFSEGFFNLVVYANKVDSKTGKLEGVFIYDERDPENPLSVVARRGLLVQQDTAQGPSVQLKLFDGDIHRKKTAHTKVKFQQSDFRLSENLQFEDKEKSSGSLTLEELRSRIRASDSPEEVRLFETELHKRWAISFACLIFALLGVGLGSQTNKREQKSGVVVICSTVILLYWIFYVAAEGAARSGQIPPTLALWFPNLFFGVYSIFALRKTWN